MSINKTIIISISILIIAGGITLVVFLTEPAAKREGATLETAMLVEVIKAEKGNYKPEIITTGTVRPSQDIYLSPRVSGQITYIADVFSPGGFVNEGDVLLQIDPADYHNTVTLRKSELQQALSDLNIEKGMQNVARNDYQFVEDSLSDENRSLVLREPQMDAARSRVEAARAALRQAELDLQRTTIKAPFDAHILSRNVNKGSQVTQGENLGHLVGIEEYWVIATVPLAHLEWLNFPENSKEGSAVKVRNRTAWDENVYRSGKIYRLIGALEENTRLARVLVTIDDPLSRLTNADQPQLIIGAFVEARILAKELRDVIRLSRDYVRKNNTVWIMHDNKLKIRDVNIIFQDNQYAYISEGIEEGDQVVTTNLSTVVEDVPLRTEENDRSGSLQSENNNSVNE